MNSQHVLIRQITEEDRHGLFVLAKELSTSFQVEEECFNASFGEIISSPDAFVIGAERGNQLIGYLMGFVHGSFYANGRVGWIEELFVREDWRRNGVGRLLVESFESWASKHQARLISLATRRASQFYLRLGYEESATYFRKIPQNCGKYCGKASLISPG